MSGPQSPKDRGVAVLAIFGIVAISIGFGAAFGWPFGLLCIGVIALLISLGAA